MPQTKLLLLYPIGAQVVGQRSKLWLKLCNAEAASVVVQGRWKASDGTAPAPERAVTSGFFGGVDLEFDLAAPDLPGDYLLELAAVDTGICDARAMASLQVPVRVRGSGAAAFAADPVPLSYAWGTDRGLPVHRLHLEQFLAHHASDIRGHCLEFQEARYAPRFGGVAVKRLDILHLDDSNPNATIVADITAPNDIPDGTYDCIVCTHVLHSIFHLERALAGLYRILAPDGVLLIGAPQISMCDRRFDELWRFTALGLERLLYTAFPPGAVSVSAFGNSFTSAGELRGMVASEFPKDLLDWHDERFAAEICARAQRPD
jgi:SAM-dependent methyltransferase